MKRFAVALAVVLALGISSTALAGGHGRHGGGHGGGHHSVSRHHGHHGHHGRRPHPPVVRIYAPSPYYYPPVQVYYPPRPYYYRSAEANLAIGIGRVVGAAIEMGR